MFELKKLFGVIVDRLPAMSASPAPPARRPSDAVLAVPASHEETHRTACLTYLRTTLRYVRQLRDAERSPLQAAPPATPVYPGDADAAVWDSPSLRTSSSSAPPPAPTGLDALPMAALMELCSPH